MALDDVKMRLADKNMDGPIFAYNQEVKAIVDEFFWNQTLKAANTTFAQEMLTPFEEGMVSRLSCSLHFFLGFIANLFIVYLSFFNKNLKQDF